MVFSEKFEKDGILIIEDFLSMEEVTSIRYSFLIFCWEKWMTSKNFKLIYFIETRNEIYKIVENMDPVKDRGIFSTTSCQQVG